MSESRKHVKATSARFGGALRQCIEERIAATHIGMQHVFHADSIRAIARVDIHGRPQFVLLVPPAKARHRTRSAPCETSECVKNQTSNQLAA